MTRPRTFRLRVAYDGRAYAGWQVQPGESTVQGVLEHAASAINGEPTRILGAGRTDAGVHARGQAARFVTGRGIPSVRVPHALNSELPADVVVTGAVEVDADFHPISDARWKRYRYTFREGEFPDPLTRHVALHVRGTLDVEAMRTAGGFLVGERDFAAWQKSGSPRTSTVRTLRRLDVSRDGAYIHVDFVGNGFLYGMARNLAGTLWRVGRGRLPAESIPSGPIVEGRAAALDPDAAGPCLPSHGLCLMKVTYAEDDR